MGDAMVDLEASLGRLRALQNEAGNNKGAEPTSGTLMYSVLNDVIVSITEIRSQLTALEIRLQNLEPQNPA